MELIPSFAVDHTRIHPGIFVSRVDTVGDSYVTTYDIRLKRPNIEPRIDVMAMHSLEHIIATYLRNDPIWKDEVIYWGPMGCLTGFYLILKGKRPSPEIYDLILRAFRYARDYEGQVPGTTPENCGAYLMHDLELAQYYASEFVFYLRHADKQDLFEYPKSERATTDQGLQFFDS